jgi:hypothetical protein
MLCARTARYGVGAAEAALPKAASSAPVTTPAVATAPMHPNMVRARPIMVPPYSDVWHYPEPRNCQSHSTTTLATG